MTAISISLREFWEDGGFDKATPRVSWPGGRSYGTNAISSTRPGWQRRYDPNSLAGQFIGLSSLRERFSHTWDTMADRKSRSQGESSENSERI